MINIIQFNYRDSLNKVGYWLVLLVFITAWLSFPIDKVKAATLVNASLTLSDSRPVQASVTHTFGWTEGTDGSIRCIMYRYVTTQTGTTVPTSLVTTGGAKGTFGGITGASWTGDFTTNGTIKLTNASGENPSGAVSTAITGITNAAAGTFYIKIDTFNNTDCSTSPVDNAVIAAVTTESVEVSATIDPTLTFTVAGLAAGANLKGSINVSDGCTDTATTVTFPAGPTDPMVADTNYQCGQSLTTSTNSDDGYTVTTRGTHSSSDFLKHTGDSSTTITDHTGTNASPTAFPTGTGVSGSEAFGYTTDDATLGTGTAGRFGTNDVWAQFVNSGSTATEVAYSAGPVNAEVTKIGLRLRFTNVTDAGNYKGTLIYTCTPIF